MEMTGLELATSIEQLQKTLGALLRLIEPRTSEEWDIQEKLTAANRQIRKIDTGTIRQSSMDL